ncbi:hypothetical protein CFE70_002632 [Pyrenophora teres f. teres 0-1]
MPAYTYVKRRTLLRCSWPRTQGFCDWRRLYIEKHDQEDQLNRTSAECTSAFDDVSVKPWPPTVPNLTTYTYDIYQDGVDEEEYFHEGDPVVADRSRLRQTEARLIKEAEHDEKAKIKKGRGQGGEAAEEALGISSREDGCAGSMGVRIEEGLVRPDSEAIQLCILA